MFTEEQQKMFTNLFHSVLKKNLASEKFIDAVLFYSCII